MTKDESKRLQDMTDEDIDYSDIPELTDEELERFRPARDYLKKAETLLLPLQRLWLRALCAMFHNSPRVFFRSLKKFREKGVFRVFL